MKKRRLRKRLGSAFKRRRMLLAKSVNIIPHVFTLGNAFFGFISIIFASHDLFISASYCILVGALMDALDGRVARMLNVESPLGIELDSLSDAITFCLAPAYLVYYSFLLKLGPLGVFICATYVLSGIFRLARFNLISGQQTVFFLGLPTTIAACFLSSLFLNIKSFVYSINISILLSLLMLLMAVLMVSKIPFPAFKNINLTRRRYFKFVAVVIFAIVTVFRFKKVLLGVFISYFLMTIYFLIFNKRSK